MDKIIEKKPRPIWHWAVVAASVLAVLLIGGQLFSRTGSSRLSVDPARLTTGLVLRGDFHEYYPFDGTVEPATSVYLDVEQGGRVDEILVEGGQQVQQGDLILRFSNASLERNAIETETRLLENLDIHRNTQFNRAQGHLLLKETLLELDHQIQDLGNRYRRMEALSSTGHSPFTAEQVESTRDQLQYLKDRRALLAERIRQEELLSSQQLAQAQQSIEKINQSMELLGRIVKSLELRAPITGFLSTINAEVGQNVPPGQRIGQIDLLDSFKVRARIDQYYISRVAVGTPGQVSLDGRSWEVRVQKVYPEVRQNTFEADVVFVDEAPGTLKRGQTLTVELSFGSPTQGLTVPKGGFYQQTSGRWVYLISEDGRTARRVDVRMGRQNPRQVEVLEGLSEGDRIITSGYDAFNGVDELRFSEKLTFNQDKS